MVVDPETIYQSEDGSGCGLSVAVCLVYKSQLMSDHVVLRSPLHQVINGLPLSEDTDYLYSRRLLSR
jgi:hypothetical protein